MTTLQSIRVAALALTAVIAGPGIAQVSSRAVAARAAIHPVTNAAAMAGWLGRVPATRDFPPDLASSLRGQAPAFVVEMSSAAGCIPCADLWARLLRFRARYGWRVAVIGGEEAMLRSGRLGLPWVGHPVAWVRAVTDPNRMIPVTIGTDLDVNLTRNIYLAAKMLTGVRPAVGVRAMAKFTGIVGAARPPPR